MKISKMRRQRSEPKSPYESFSYTRAQITVVKDQPNFYSCTINKNNDQSIKKAHEEGKTDEDVNILSAIHYSTFPRGITKRFKNLHTLVIEDLKFSELRREDFEGLENLKDFSVFCAPQLKCLDGDIFDDLKSIESIGFYNTPISTIGEGIFSKLTNLKMVFMLQCQVINAAFVDSSR